MQWTGQEPALNEDSEWGRQAGKFKEEHSIFQERRRSAPCHVGEGLFLNNKEPHTALDIQDPAWTLIST